MKKTGLLVALMLTATFAVSQVSSTATTAVTPEADGLVHTSVNMPFVRFQTPTAADIYCAGLDVYKRQGGSSYSNLITQS